MTRVHFLRAVAKKLKYAHRYPANWALCIGAPFYVIGLASALGHFAGPIAMFVIGGDRTQHPIDDSVLLIRLLSKVAQNFMAQGVHFVPT